MEAPRASSPTRSQGLPSQRGSRLARLRFGFVRHVALPWCKAHAVSIALLMAFPMSIAIYYWTRPDSGSAPLPNYMQSERSERTQPPLEPLPKVEPTAVAGMALELPTIREIPEPVTFAHGFEVEDGAPPLPIAVEHPKPISRANEAPTQAWPGHAMPTDPPIGTAAQGAWFTGSIEPVESQADPIQNASRVHELTMPSRN